MKTLLRIFFLIAIISLITTCSKTDEFFEDAPIMLKAGKIKIMPSKATDVLIKAQEDWNSIHEALQSAGQGEVVQLGEGLFYLHKSIIKWDFNGTLKGSGMKKTTIQTAPGMEFNVSDCPLLEWSWQTREGHSIICFPHRSNTEERTVFVSDLTIIGNEPATEWHSDMINNPTFTNNTLQAVTVYYENLLGIDGYYGNQSLSDKINLNVRYKNISVIGEEDPIKYPLGGFSFRLGLAAFGASSGNFEADNIYIANADHGLLPHVFCGENSTVSIKNSKVENVKVGIYSFLVPNYNVINNELKNCFQNGLSINTANHNYALPNGSSIIKDNLFFMETPSYYGINTSRMLNVEVFDNKFIGNSYSGIIERYGINYVIKDNDLCDLNVRDSDGFTIILVASTDNVIKDNANQVVGGPSASDPSNIIGVGRVCK